MVRWVDWLARERLSIRFVGSVKRFGAHSNKRPKQLSSPAGVGPHCQASNLEKRNDYDFRTLRRKKNLWAYFEQLWGNLVLK